jgi:hypothetical protein
LYQSGGEISKCAARATDPNGNTRNSPLTTQAKDGLLLFGACDVGAATNVVRELNIENQRMRFHAVLLKQRETGMIDSLTTKRGE